MKDFKRKIEILKIIAHPIRIRLLQELKKNIHCVSDLIKILKVRQSTISQHLALLRKGDLVDYYVEGKERCYFIKDPFVSELLDFLSRDQYKPLEVPKCCPITKKRLK